MSGRDELVDENRRLKAVTQQTWVRVVESKLSVILTLCTAAETCLSVGDQAQAGSLVEQAEQMAASAGVSSAAIHDAPDALLCGQLEKLKVRIGALRLRLR